VRQLFGRSEPRVTWLRVAAVIALLLTLLTPIGWWEALALILIAELIDRAKFYAARSGIGAWRFSPDRA
jgi:hypothetical protein